jgi:agmatinase
MDGYRPVDPRESPRFSGIKSFMRLPHVKTTEGVDFAIVGVPFDTGASFRVGARFGPEAIRNVSALLRHHNEVLDVSARAGNRSQISFSTHLHRNRLGEGGI